MGKNIWVGVLNKDKLYIKFNYDEEKIRNIKTINGRRWELEKRYWTIPYMSIPVQFEPSVRYLRAIIPADKSQYSGGRKPSFRR
ncbi:MAG: hypothetical protein PHG06_18100 [Parabacteroides sp.]|nr:hypothetical protein [Parabacteroides sp.]